MTPEIVAAIIATAGALVSGMFTAYNVQRGKRLDKIENEQSASDKERLKSESEIWKRFSNLHDDFLTRREHEIYTKLLEEIRQDLKILLGRTFDDRHN